VNTHNTDAQIKRIHVFVADICCTCSYGPTYCLAGESLSNKTFYSQKYINVVLSL